MQHRFYSLRTLLIGLIGLFILIPAAAYAHQIEQLNLHQESNSVEGKTIPGCDPNGTVPGTTLPGTVPCERPRIIIRLEADPATGRDFDFAGDLGKFDLEDDDDDRDKGRKKKDDDDSYKRFRVRPGTYQVGQLVPDRWILVDIACEGGITEPNLAGAFVTITANYNDEITCTFRNQRESTIRVRKYHDSNNNGERNRGEGGLPGWVFTLYNAAGETVTSGTSNIYGKVNFTGVVPGSYTLCESSRDGWNNTQPGTLDPNFGNQACYQFEARPAKLVYVRFGNLESDALVASSEQQTANAAGVIEIDDPYVDDASNMSDNALDLTRSDDPLIGDVSANDLFLPVIIR